MQSLPLTVREVKVTEAVLDRIYAAAKLGLKGDSLAANAGLWPSEYRQLCVLDPMVELTELKGRADGEAEMSSVLRQAALQGDSKAALSVLQHVHGWVAKQSMSIEVEQRISVIDALRAAEGRVIEGQVTEVIENQPSPRLGSRVENRNAEAHIQP